MLKTLGAHAKASLPCSLLPLHRSLLFSLIFAKEQLSLALLAPPVAPSLSIPTTIVKGQNTLASHNALASLVKGELLLLGLTNPTMVWIVIAQKSFS